MQGSERHLRAIFDTMFAFVGLIDLDGAVVEVNLAPLAAAGLARKDVLGRRVWDTYWFSHCPDVQARVRSDLALAASGDSTRREYVIRIATGRTITIDCTFAPLRDSAGTIVEIVGSAVDVTERKESELRAGRLNRTYAVLSSINQLIVRERELSRVLDGACRIAVEQGGFLLAWLGLTDTPDGSLRRAAHMGAAADTLEIIDDMLRKPQLGCAFALRALSTGRQVVCADIANDPLAAPWRDAALERGYRCMAAFPLRLDMQSMGTLSLYAGEIGFFDDQEVSLLNELADDIAFAISVNRREHERRELARQLYESQKMDAIGQLASGIAHDFNNILATILGNAQLAQLELGGRQAGSLNEIVRAGQRAKDLVQRILAFSRPQAHQRSAVQLHPVVSEAVTLLRATLPAGVQLALHDAPRLPSIEADTTQIHQIVLNLVTNAWHALEDRPGRIDITLESCRLDGDLARRARPAVQPGSYVRLSVADTGKGMDAPTLTRVFEPFFTTKPAGQGTGLGLAVVHDIMRGHGGGIVTESEPGRGTTFHLYFPASCLPAAPPPAPLAALTTQGTGEHILYLDDEESLVVLFEKLFEHLGYRVSAYTQADAAIEAFRAQPETFDLVITDMNMPGTSGLEVARQLLEIRRDAQVVLASGHLRPGEIELARGLGVRETILKPNTIEELARVVHSLLRGSGAR
jgi:PAS domain S-box-containing protein